MFVNGSITYSIWHIICDLQKILKFLSFFKVDLCFELFGFSYSKPHLEKLTDGFITID